MPRSLFLAHTHVLEVTLLKPHFLIMCCYLSFMSPQTFACGTCPPLLHRATGNSFSPHIIPDSSPFLPSQLANRSLPQLMRCIPSLLSCQPQGRPRGHKNQSPVASAGSTTNNQQYQCPPSSHPFTQEEGKHHLDFSTHRTSSGQTNALE